MKYVVKAVGVLLFVLSNYAIAGDFHCSGVVSSIALGPKNGTLQVNAGYGVHYLCKIHVEFNGVHPEICKAWYSMFLTAQASGKEISQSYNGDSGGATNCTELGNWQVPNPIPYYVNINK